MKTKMVYIVAALALVFSLTAVIMPANPAQADTITVTNLLDSGDGSLRWAIGNATTGDDIDFAVTGTITLTSGQLYIDKDLTITGPGAANLAISGGDNSRVFAIVGCTVVMSGLTIEDGNVVGTGSDGGGIYNENGDVTLNNCTISSNEAREGGGIFNDGGELRMTNCTISGNTATSIGGGISSSFGVVKLTLTGCTISGNEADEGGGIFNNENGDVTLNNCTISGNEAVTGDGGGIYNYSGTVTLINCTVSGNTADGEGGGIYNNDELTMINCTVSDNTAEGGESGGGIYNSAEVGNVTMTCTIVYGNIADPAPNIYGSYNDIGNESIVDTPNPLLGLLQDNGGPTFTHALLDGSPAIDACIVSCNLTTDQRGQPRPVDGDLDGSAFCDVGAYEKQVLPVGGIVEPVDRIGILAPWLGLAVFTVVAMAIVVLLKRRRVA